MVFLLLQMKFELDGMLCVHVARGADVDDHGETNRLRVGVQPGLAFNGSTVAATTTAVCRRAAGCPRRPVDRLVPREC